MKKIEKAKMLNVVGGISPAGCALIGFFVVGWIAGPAVLGEGFMTCWRTN